tara:strand:- start:208 stop:567 length:360 start_codon:yes stop_codon:yes gene_type:complete
MPTPLMTKLGETASALYAGNLHDQLKRVQINLGKLDKQYEHKLSQFDVLKKQQEEQLDKVKTDLFELFAKIQEEKKIYYDIKNNIASLTKKVGGRRIKRKTKLKKMNRRKNKNKTKKRR